MTPLVSVIFPTRGRPCVLLDSVGSLLSHATKPEAVEILLAVDPDDELSRQAESRVFARVPQVKVWTAPQRWGYAGLYRYYNRLAERARGEWLMLWNDDARMLTQGWDQVIAGQTPGILWPEADYAPEIATFPVFPRAWASYLGRVSADQSCDMWWHHLGLLTGTLRKIPVRIHHEHITGDATAIDRDAAASVSTFWSPQMAAARERDAARLLKLTG